MAWKTLELTRKQDADLEREFKKKARFLVDESLGEELAADLRGRGWNAKHVGETGLSGRADEDILARAYRDNRVLLTQDKDFLDDRRFPPHRNPGLVVLPAGGSGDAHVAESLERVLIAVGRYRELYRAMKVTISPGGAWTVKYRDTSTGAMKKTRFKVTRHGTPFIWEDE